MFYNQVSLKGKRPTNEDNHDIIINLNGELNQENKEKNEYNKINYYGVYDGHGGNFVSKFLSENLTRYFMHKDVNMPITKSKVTKLYNSITNILKTKFETKSNETGSTCLVILHYKNEKKEYLQILNTGDSRAVICREGVAIPITKDHKPNFPEETHRIKKIGGDIKFDGVDHRIEGLSVSRAFGDLSASPYVTNIPDMYMYKLSMNDTFLILACDGLWDVLTNQEVVNFVIENCYDMETKQYKRGRENIAKKLGEYAIKKGSQDNVTIIIVFFR